MRGTLMTTLRSWAQTFESIGKAGRSVDRWAALRHRRHRDRQLSALHVFDGTRFGYRYRTGGMGRLAQYRTAWWRELLVAARAEDASAIILRTDQVRWIVGRLDAEPDGSGESDRLT
jgi:hypothetical protein